MIEGTLWFIMAAVVVIVAIVLVLMRRFQSVVRTNERIEENQRRAIDLSERQTVALERIAASLEAR